MESEEVLVKCSDRVPWQRQPKMFKDWINDMRKQGFVFVLDVETRLPVGVLSRDAPALYNGVPMTDVDGKLVSGKPSSKWVLISVKAQYEAAVKAHQMQRPAKVRDESVETKPLFLPRRDPSTCIYCSVAVSGPERVATEGHCRLCGAPLQPLLLPTSDTIHCYSSQFRKECRLLLLVCVRYRICRDVRCLLIQALTCAHFPVARCCKRTVSEWITLSWFTVGKTILCHLRCLEACKIDSKLFSTFPLFIGRWNLSPFVMHNSNGCNGLESAVVEWKEFSAGQTDFFIWDLTTAFNFNALHSKTVVACRTFVFVRGNSTQEHNVVLTL